MLFLKQGSESTLPCVYLTGHCSTVSLQILKKFVRPLVHLTVVWLLCD